MIVALMYHDADLEATMALARLLADIEPRRRDDVALALVCQPDTPTTPLVAATAIHCTQKFSDVAVLPSPRGAHGHPEGCTALWTGTVEHFYKQWRNGELEHDDILTLDGGDSIPLHRNWIEILAREHNKTTLSARKFVTGTPYFCGTCPLHVNPNALYALSLFGKTKMLTDVPKYDGTLSTNFDVYHREEMLANTQLSSAIRTDWRGCGRAPTLDILRERARESVWLHGYRAPNLTWLCREHLLSNPAPPEIKYYELDSLRLHEKVRRNYEESCG